MAQVPPQEWHPAHKLESIALDLYLDDTKGHMVRIRGYADTKRADLWGRAEVFGDDVSDLTIADFVAHFLTVCLQDRPNSEDRLTFGLSGGLHGEQQGLF